MPTNYIIMARGLLSGVTTLEGLDLSFTSHLSEHMLDMKHSVLVLALQLVTVVVS